MPRQAVHVAGRLGPMIAERGAAVLGAHQPAQLDAHQHHLGIVRARCDPAHVRGPGPGRKAPLRPRRDLLKRHQLLPALAAVAAAEQPAGLGSRVHGAVRRAHRDAEHVRLRQRHVFEGVAAVSAALQAASPTPDVHGVAVERQALRPRTLQARVRTDPHERVTGRRKQLHRPQDRASPPRVRAEELPARPYATAAAGADGEPCAAAVRAERKAGFCYLLVRPRFRAERDAPSTWRPGKHASPKRSVRPALLVRCARQQRGGGDERVTCGSGRSLDPRGHKGCERGSGMSFVDAGTPPRGGLVRGSRSGGAPNPARSAATVLVDAVVPSLLGDRKGLT